MFPFYFLNYFFFLLNSHLWFINIIRTERSGERRGRPHPPLVVSNPILISTKLTTVTHTHTNERNGAKERGGIVKYWEEITNERKKALPRGLISSTCQTTSKEVGGEGESGWMHENASFRSPPSHFKNNSSAPILYAYLFFTLMSCNWRECVSASRQIASNRLFFSLTDIFMLMLHKLIIIHSHEFLPHLRLIKTPFLFVFFFQLGKLWRFTTHARCWCMQRAPS